MKINPWTTIATWHKLRADNVLVYKVNKQDLTDIDGILSQADYLSPLEVKRAKQYKYKKDHDTYLLARCALRQITAQHLHINPQDLSLHFGEYGKPYSPDYPKYHFNLSHSGDMILIGIASSPLGVDVEYCNDTIDYLSIANSVFSKEEISSLTSLNSKHRGQAFYNIWTKKEAYIKAIGKGLQAPLVDFSLRAFDNGYSNLTSVKWDHQECHNWQVFNVEMEGPYQAALSVGAGVGEVELVGMGVMLS